MTDDDFAALVVKRLDGSINPEEDILLITELETGEGRRRTAASLGRVHGGLLETLSADRERDALSRRRRGAALALAAAILLAAGIGVLALRHDEPPVRPARSWSFDGLPAGETPPGFEVFASGRTSAGRWVVLPGGLLGQTDDRPAERFAGAVAVEPSYRDVRVSARVRLVSGYQRAGIVWGWRDPDHYYVAAINPIERNLRVDRVEGGRRVELADRNLKTLTGQWYRLRIERRGDRLVAYVDDLPVAEIVDPGHEGPGRVGVWIKDDTVAEFDDLRAEPLP